MRVLFIQDSIDSESIGVAYLSAVLKKEGYSTELIIASLEEDFWERIVSYSPDIICFSIVITKQYFYLKLGELIKRRFPKIIIVIGGPFVTLDHSIIKEGWVDYAIVGEGEEAIVELVRAIEKGDNVKDIQNLIYKDDVGLRINELRRLNEDLDSLPLPDRSLYVRYKSFRDLTVKRFLSGRGCPYSCSFCFIRRLRDIYRDKGRYVRKHSPDRVCEEIKEMQKIAVVKTVHFSDDIFVIDKKLLEDFASIYPKKIGLPFQCNITATLITEDTVRLLKEAGLRGVGIGLESGVERIRNEVLKKKFTNEEIIEVAQLLKKYKIEIYTYNMIALPEERIEDALLTLEINRRMGVSITQCNIAIPFSGLPITEMALNSSLLEDEKRISALSHRPESPLFRVEKREEFERLFFLFPFVVKTGLSISIIKILLKTPLNLIYKIFHQISYIMNMKRYYGISLFSGFKMFLDIKRGESFIKRFLGE